MRSIFALLLFIATLIALVASVEYSDRYGLSSDVEDWSCSAGECKVRVEMRSTRKTATSVGLRLSVRRLTRYPVGNQIAARVFYGKLLPGETRVQDFSLPYAVNPLIGNKLLRSLFSLGVYADIFKSKRPVLQLDFLPIDTALQQLRWLHSRRNNVIAETPSSEN